jgi:hypothetical protein
MLTSLLKAAAAVVTVPAAVAADVMTLGGTLQEKPRQRSYTSEALTDLASNLKDATRPAGDHE